jgi:hypothetical protein
VLARVTVLAAVLTALLAAPAHARKVSIVYFKTPSHNIVCMFAGGLADTKPFVVCAIKSGLKPPPPKVRCREGDPTDEFVDLEQTGKATAPSCAGDPGPLVGEKQARVLKYGHTFKRKGLRCTSAVKGLTCRNKSHHGFFLSRGHSRRF